MFYYDDVNHVKHDVIPEAIKVERVENHRRAQQLQELQRAQQVEEARRTREAQAQYHHQQQQMYQQQQIYQQQIRQQQAQAVHPENGQPIVAVQVVAGPAGGALLEFTVPDTVQAGMKVCFNANLTATSRIHPQWMSATIPTGCGPGWKLKVPCPPPPAPISVDLTM